LNKQERVAQGPYLAVAVMPKSGKIVHTQVREHTWMGNVLDGFHFTIVFVSSFYNCSYVWMVALQMESRVHMDQFEAVLSLAKEGCLGLYKVMRKLMTDRTTDLVAQMGLGS
jgi:hypothetical protein